MLIDTKDLFNGSVVLCPKCNGLGKILELVGHIENDYTLMTCSLCHGDRVMRIMLERIETLREINMMED